MQTKGFLVGCNYWASHAGTRMWSDFRADVVREDFRRLYQTGVRTIRLFPLWSDFQPLHLLRQGHGQPAEYRHGESPLADDPIGAAGVDPAMLDRFRAVADAAEQTGIKLIVGLVTGWMSGRFYAPEALSHLNAITDAESICWQVRFVRLFVRTFRGHTAILAWDLGNECNCMGQATRAQAWAWTHAISSVIRVEDPTRPVYSGMHSLPANPNLPWSIADQAELTDMLCTHPYPAFTPGCDLDPLNTFRPAHHAAVETALYSDLGAKPGLVEEIGSLGNEFASEQNVADYIRMSLYTSWAMGAKGFLWWCGFDQLHLTHAPYDWCSVERELGLLRMDGSAKPVANELRSFGEFISSLPQPLPPRLTHAVCLLTDSQDHWRVAYATALLARQARAELRFAWHTKPLPDSRIYFVPCYSGLTAMRRRTWLELIERVKQGATLYLSHNDGLLTLFKETTGLEVLTRNRSSAPTQFTIEPESYSVPTPIHLELRSVGAQVLASDPDGNPVFASYQLGQGRVFLLSVPLEYHIAHTPGILADAKWSAIYQRVLAGCELGRATAFVSPMLGVTEHPLDDNRRIIVQVNYGSEPLPAAQPVAPWRITGCLAGTTDLVRPMHASILTVSRTTKPVRASQSSRAHPKPSVAGKQAVRMRSARAKGIAKGR